MFPAIQTQPAYTVSKAERALQSWLGSLASSIGQRSAPSLQSGGISDESISPLDRAEYWLERTRFRSAFFSLSESIGLGGAWVPPEGAEHLGCTNPSTSTRTLPTLTAVGELLDEVEDAVFKGPAEPLGVVFKGPAEPLGAVFKGPAEPLGAILERTTEPLEAVLEGLAEPLEAVLEGLAEPLAISEFFAESHGTRVSADVCLDLLEEA